MVRRPVAADFGVVSGSNLTHYGDREEIHATLSTRNRKGVVLGEDDSLHSTPREDDNIECGNASDGTRSVEDVSGHDGARAPGNYDDVVVDRLLTKCVRSC